MAFMGVLLSLAVMVIGFVILVMLFAVAPIVIGSILIAKTPHRVIGIVIRIIGFLNLIPSVIGGVIFALLLHDIF